MRLRWSAIYAMCILFGAGVLIPLLAEEPLLAPLIAREWVHILVHALLYGILASLLVAARCRSTSVFAASMTIAALQEGAQLLWLRRPPGSPELFDLVVDACAVVAVLLLRRRSSRTKDSATSDVRGTHRRA